jgi:hypothetical protein
MLQNNLCMPMQECPVGSIVNRKTNVCECQIQGQSLIMNSCRCDMNNIVRNNKCVCDDNSILDSDGNC